MSTRQVVGITLALTLLAAVCAGGWVLIHDRSESAPTIRPPDAKALSKQGAPRNANPATVLPPEDVPGREIPGLPRYPQSVRVEYERKEQEGLEIVRASYLTRDGLDAVRGFYRGIFRAEGWSVANVEFSEGEWTFLVVDGKKEANVDIEPHGRGITRTDIELSEPLPKKETPKQESRPAPQRSAPPQSATPVPYQSASPAPQSASPAPQWASPAPDDDYYEEGGEGGDDYGDDGGGDD